MIVSGLLVLLAAGGLGIAGIAAGNGGTRPHRSVSTYRATIYRARGAGCSSPISSSSRRPCAG